MSKNIVLILACLSLFSLLSAQQQLENPGFEHWENVVADLDEPVDWSSIKTSDNETTNQFAPLVWERSSDSHSGLYAVKLTNILILSVIATGTLTNGRVHAHPVPDSGYVYTQPDDARWHTAFTSKPDSLVGWYKFFPVDNDHGGVRAILHTKEGALPEHGTQQNWIADAIFNMPETTVDIWTRFSVKFNYFSDDTPEYILVVMKAGNGTHAIAGSYALFDDLQLIYNNPGGIHQNIQNTFSMYHCNRKVYIHTDAHDMLMDATFRLLDINGHIVYQTSIMTPVISLPSDLHAGIYIGCILYGNGIMSEKIYLD